MTRASLSSLLASLVLALAACGGPAKGGDTTASGDNGGDTATLAPVAAAPIDGAALVATPVCLGFLPDGTGAYVLTSDIDRSASSWTVAVTPAGTATPVEIGMTVEAQDGDTARAGLESMVDPINQLITSSGLVACDATTAEGTGKLTTVLAGAVVVVSLGDGALVIAHSGAEAETRPQDSVESLSLLAAYTAPGAGVAIVLQDAAEGGLHVDRVEWVAP
jgi:hypothetical protein